MHKKRSVKGGEEEQSLADEEGAIDFALETRNSMMQTKHKISDMYKSSLQSQKE
jgi:hypothetical protein